jgi:hypothetical protein
LSTASPDTIQIGDYDLSDWANDPLAFAECFWPHVTFYRQQREIILSVRDNDETYVVAGNGLGKDFVSGFIVLHFFLTRSPCRIITTSATDRHLNVLWGEMGRFIQTCRFDLDATHGGPLIINQRKLRKMVDGKECKMSYVEGIVAGPDTMEAMGGHHDPIGDPRCPRSLFIGDEASALHDDYYKKASPWFKRALFIGNAWPCNNFFRKHVKDGNVLAS